VKKHLKYLNYIILIVFLISCEKTITEADKVDKLETNNGFGIIIPDPITMKSYNWVRKIDYKLQFSTDSGRIYFPTTSPLFNAPPAAKLPLVILMHGNGYSFKHYNYIQKHLAKNGFIVASIRWDSYGFQFNSKYLEIFNEIRSHLLHLYGAFQYSNYLSTDVVLMGHSRGGMAAIRYFDIPKDIGLNLKSIVSLAPSPQSYDMPIEFDLDDETKSVLFLYGSADSDVNGTKLNGVMKTAFKLYDDIATESSYWVFNKSPERDMIFLEDFNHRIFTEKENWPGDINALASPEKDAIMGYINGYLQLHVKNNSLFKTYYKYQSRPASLDAGIELFHQHSDRVKTVLANFENGSSNTNTAGGAISKGFNIDKFVVGNSWQLDNQSPHHTKVLQLQWDKKNFFVPYVKFSYSNYKNLTNYNYLALRIGQVNGSSYNSNSDKDLYVRLRSTNNATFTLKLSDYGRLAYDYNLIGAVNKSFMTTFMIPLKDFRNVDLSHVKDLYLQFNVNGHTKGEVVIDNIEFYK
jgi:pimeloyl-ACP methyl ester carboxylesterase